MPRYSAPPELVRVFDGWDRRHVPRALLALLLFPVKQSTYPNDYNPALYIVHVASHPTLLFVFCFLPASVIQE